jgi:hypothetical protein
MGLTSHVGNSIILGEWGPVKSTLFKMVCTSLIPDKLQSMQLNETRESAELSQKYECSARPTRFGCSLKHTLYLPGYAYMLVHSHRVTCPICGLSQEAASRYNEAPA